MWGTRPQKGGDSEIRVVSPPHTPVDRQPRMALQYEDSAYLQNQPESGVIISVFLAIIAFGVIVSS